MKFASALPDEKGAERTFLFVRVFRHQKLPEIAGHAMQAAAAIRAPGR
jgi:hypothetical protein